jgi:hypothetical protein
MSNAPVPTPRRYAAEWLALLLAFAVAAALITYELVQAHAGIEAMERDRLASQTRVIDDNIGQQLDGISKALASVRAEYLRPPDQRTANTSSRLKVLSDAIPGVRNMFILDAEGNVVASSEPALIAKNFRERDYFAVPNLGRDGRTLYVSRPFTTVLGNFVIVIGRVLTNARGGFEGLVVAGLDTDYFEVVMRSVLYAADMRATLADAEGRSFLDLPKTAPAPPSAASAPRLVASRAVAPPQLHMDKPLVVVISRGEAAVFRLWRSHAIELVGLFVILLASRGAGRSTGLPLRPWPSEGSGPSGWSSPCAGRISASGTGTCPATASTTTS